MTKKVFSRLTVLLGTLAFIVSCGNPVATAEPKEEVKDPIIASYSGATIATATLTTEVKEGTSSGVQLIKEDDTDVIKVSAVKTTEDKYEIRCEILFSEELDLSEAKTLTFNSLMKYSSTIITLKTVNKEADSDDVTTLGVSWHGSQAEKHMPRNTLWKQCLQGGGILHGGIQPKK
jgi:hypothetical protein